MGGILGCAFGYSDVPLISAYYKDTRSEDIRLNNINKPCQNTVQHTLPCSILR